MILSGDADLNQLFAQLRRLQLGLELIDRQIADIDVQLANLPPNFPPQMAAQLRALRSNLATQRDIVFNQIRTLQQHIAAEQEGQYTPPDYTDPEEEDPVQTSGNDSTATAIMWGSAALVLLALYGVSRPSRR